MIGTLCFDACARNKKHAHLLECLKNAWPARPIKYVRGLGQDPLGMFPEQSAVP